jgi:hypothetical protein
VLVEFFALGMQDRYANSAIGVNYPIKFNNPTIGVPHRSQETELRGIVRVIGRELHRGLEVPTLLALMGKVVPRKWCQRALRTR